MSTDSRSPPLAWKARWGAHIRNAIPGMKYATLVTLGLMLGWDTEDFIDDVAKLGWAPALKSAGMFMLVMALHQLPPIPAVAIAVELAPRSGTRRYLWLVGVGVALWAYCTMFWFILGELEAMNIRYGFMVALIVDSLRLSELGADRVERVHAKANRGHGARRRREARPLAALAGTDRATFSFQHASRPCGRSRASTDGRRSKWSII